MDLISQFNLRAPLFSFPPTASFFYRASPLYHILPFSYRFHRFAATPIQSYGFKLRAKNKHSQPAPSIDPMLIEEVMMDDDEEDEQLIIDEEFIDEEDEDFADEYLEDEPELSYGDGGGGGGIALAGTWWDKEALRIAEEVCESFDGELKLYAFKTLINSRVQVRIERLTNKSGSPDMDDIEAFTRTYRARLDEAELAKSVPDNLYLEEEKRMGFLGLISECSTSIQPDLS